MAEQLVRRRGPGERQRYAIAQRRGRVDPNPHQINAVVFALQRIPEGGCILADEVGLGKTIEAGLIMAQLLAEGARRILILVPKPLQGQWRAELDALFAIQAREVTPDPQSLAGDGVFLVGREFAGGDRGASLIRTADPFDLCVIDEAHEYFAGIYKRFDRDGVYDPDRKVARTAGRVRDFTQQTPVLLLTATPIQNTLLEMWGLAQYVDRAGTILGNLATFRELFCTDATGRSVAPRRADELRERLANICQRTLRNQAQPFLKTPFVGRRAVTFEYAMSPEERRLYDEITDYLLDERTLAFSASNRTLLLIGFHRRMASSLAALGASLDSVAARLERWLDAPESRTGDDREAQTRLARELVGDFDDESVDSLLGDDRVSLYDAVDGADEPANGPSAEPPRAATPVAAELERELARVREFANRARALPADSKATALLDVVGANDDKLLIFTESISTQDFLRELLLEHGIADSAVTLFRGTNTSPRAEQAHARWLEEVAVGLSPDHHPSPAIAVRLALVHEFATRSRIMISTEAGAKGLNLQFCHTVINYDLPWNPQRIEQRIGRCHRYRQSRDVTVINFVAADNEAQKLTFELLSQKLELFGTVLDASDHVLHTPTSGESPEALASTIGADFTKRMRDIWAGARTLDQVHVELRALRQELEERRLEYESSVDETRSLIQSHIDDDLQQVFGSLNVEIPRALRELDQDIEDMVCAWLRAQGQAFVIEPRDGLRVLRIEAEPDSSLARVLPPDGTVALGDVTTSDAHLEQLHIHHPLVTHILAGLREEQIVDPIRIIDEGPSVRGQLVLLRIEHGGLEPVHHLRLVAIDERGEPLEAERVARWDAAQWTKAETEPARGELDDEDVADAIADAIYDDLRDVDQRAHATYVRLMDQIERYMEDRILVLKRQYARLHADLDQAEGELTRAKGPTARRQAEHKRDRVVAKLEANRDEIERLIVRDDPSYQRWVDDASRRRYAKPETHVLFNVAFESVSSTDTGTAPISASGG